MPPRRKTARLGPRELLRIVFVVVGWVGFVWMWLLVGRQPWDSRGLVWLIVGSLILVPLLTLAWVAHNRALFRRKGERRGVTPADFSYTADWHGRAIDADWALLARSRCVTVSVDGERKRYRGGDAELGPAMPLPYTAGSLPMALGATKPPAASRA